MGSLSITWVDRVASTQVALAARARDGAGAQALATTAQTAGHGRRGRTWTCPPGTGLALSVLVRLPDRPGWPWLPLVAGVAVHEALTDLGTAGIGLKWPNDLVVETGPPAGKLAGLIAERVDSSGGLEPALVLGVGINLHPGGMPEGSVALAELGVTAAHEAVAAAVVDRLENWLEAWRGDPASAAGPYRDRCVTTGQAVQVHLPGGKLLRGQASRVDDDGCLVVDVPGAGAVPVSAGDVVHLRPA